MSGSSSTRRDFLLTSAATLASLAITGVSRTVHADENIAPPTGALAGLVQAPGVPSGSPDALSRGYICLPDGRVVVATHAHNHPIASGTSVFLVPDSPGIWSILYAEA